MYEPGAFQNSADARRRIQQAMDEVVREAFEIAVRGSGPRGRWLPPAELDAAPDLDALAEVARACVLDRLEERIREARRVLDQVERPEGTRNSEQAKSERAKAGADPRAPLGGIFVELAVWRRHHAPGGLRIPPGASGARGESPGGSAGEARDDGA